MGLCLRNLLSQDSPGDITLWKYLTFEKFLDFLLLKRLYFRRVDRLRDPYECLMPRGLASGQEDDAPEAKKTLLRRHEQYVRGERARVFVNSWHISEHESEAMWKLFGGSGHSIAVQTTVGALLAALSPFEITAGKVLYRDFDQDDVEIADFLDFALLKRKPFEHEKEFRLICVSDGGAEAPRLLDHSGLHLGVDPAHVIESIYVSPLSEAWQYELSLAIIEGQGLADRVNRSTLFNCPGERE